MCCITGMYLLQWVLADTSCRFAEKKIAINFFENKFWRKEKFWKLPIQSVIREIQSVIRGN